MLNIMPWYGLNRTVKRALSEREMNYSRLRHRVYEKTVLCEMPFIVYDLTFLYISFAKKFCQKKVKKNCKSVVRVFFKSAFISREVRTRENSAAYPHPTSHTAVSTKKGWNAGHRRVSTCVPSLLYHTVTPYYNVTVFPLSRPWLCFSAPLPVRHNIPVRRSSM